MLRGEVSKKELAKIKMRAKGQPPRYYENLAKDLDYREIDELAGTAVHDGNLEALRGLADINRMAVAKNLEDPIGFKMLQQAAEKGSDIAPELFFVLRTVLKPYYKALFKNLTKLVIMKEARKIAGRGLKGMHKRRIRYIPYKTGLDVEATILNVIGKPLEYMTRSDFVGIEKTQKKRAGVLILDTSGSMYGRLIFNAALTAAVLSYHMKDNEHSIIVFNTDSEVLKAVNEKRFIDGLIDDVLEMQTSGFTNITKGLEKGIEQLQIAKSHDKFAILITDGCANRGIEMLNDVASKFNHLHVILIPSENEQMLSGGRTCEEIQRHGKGMLVRVSRFKDIPRALQKL
ncbi:MAG: vWA domain-containing protein, partial [Promethearchaeota archaeon]